MIMKTKSPMIGFDAEVEELEAEFEVCTTV